MTRTSSKLPSQRQLRVGELVRKVIADIILRQDIIDPELEGVMIMINEVRMSPDLKLATVYISEVNADLEVLEKRAKALARHAKLIRGYLGRQLAMKYVPNLRFRPDSSLFSVRKIDELLSSEKVQRDIAAQDDDTDINS